MIRSFVAIEVPDLTKDVLAKVGEELRRKVPERSVRWTRVSGIHLTLKFLGNVAEPDLGAIKETLALVAQRHAPFSFTIGGLGCFPNERRPRVLWVGIQEQTGALKALQRDVEKSLVPLGFQRERRGFHPHLTLGRTRRGVHSDIQRDLGEVVTGTNISELDRIAITCFRLMRSDLHPDGAVYTAMAEFSLSLGQEAE
jgi:2'-5' RNA ligase